MFRKRSAVVLACAVVLLVGGPISCREDRPASGGPPPPIEIVKPTPEIAFDRAFAWRPSATATSYRVVVFNDAGERTFEVRTAFAIQ